MLANCPGIANIGRKYAAKEALAASATQQLVMGREQLDLAARSDSKLNARAEDLVTSQALLDDAAVGQLG